MRIRGDPTRLVALPRPEVRPTREQAEPNQIGPAPGLEQQLTAPLGQDGVQCHLAGRDVVARVAERTLPESVEVRYPLRHVGARADSGLGVNEVRLTEAEDREIRVDHRRLRAGSAGGCLVRELGPGDTVVERADIDDGIANAVV